MSIPSVQEIEDFSRLEKIYSFAPKTTSLASPSQAVSNLSHNDLWAWVGEMESRGLLKMDDSLNPLVSLTTKGIEVVESGITKRDDSALFRQTVRERLLQWSYKRSESETDHVGVDFNGQESWYYGRIISLQDLARAAKELAENKFLWQKPLGSASEDILALLVGITHKGQECVEEYDANINDYLKSKRKESIVPSSTINIKNQYGGNASIGDNNSLISVVGEDQTEKVVELGKALREAFPLLGLDEDQKTEAITHISHLEDAKNPAQVKSGLEWAKNLAKMTGAGTLSTVLAGVAEELIKSLFGA